MTNKVKTRKFRAQNINDSLQKHTHLPYILSNFKHNMITYIYTDLAADKLRQKSYYVKNKLLHETFSFIDRQIV
jgi:hypothetical protein